MHAQPYITDIINCGSFLIFHYRLGTNFYIQPFQHTHKAHFLWTNLSNMPKCNGGLHFPTVNPT